jgi:hypothetical protein
VTQCELIPLYLQVQLQQEARDMWRVFLEQRDWEAALRQCSSSTQRDEVHRARAEAAAAARDWGSAAVHWAKVGGVGTAAVHHESLQYII